MKAEQQLHDRPDDRSATGGVLAGTIVLTAKGLMPVEYLTTGDRVVTGRGLLPLVKVKALRMPIAPLVRIRSTTQGGLLPARDLLLCPDQLVVIRDWRARVLFGHTLAAVPATRLIDGEYVVREQRRDAWLFSPVFATDEIIYAEGQEIAATDWSHLATIFSP